MPLKIAERLQSKPEQHPGEHSGGKGMRDKLHQTSKQPGYAAQQNERVGKDKNPDGLGKRYPVQAGG